VKKRQKEASARGTHIENAYAGRSLWKRKQSESRFHSLGMPAGGSDGQLNVIHPTASAHIKAIRFIVFYCRPVGFGRLPASHIIYATHSLDSQQY
jgi:hypothetical protein